MLTWFPTPYPDELLYSVFARYHVRSGNTSPKMTTEELFGKRTISSVWDLPSNINVLLSRIGPHWDADYLISNHTMYSYYAAFLLPKQAQQVKQSMLLDEGNTIHTRIGIAASNVKVKTNLWVCDDCIKEDMGAYGETYWRRLHQVPGVFICPKHKGVLQETAVSVKTKNQHEYVVATESIERTQINLDGLHEEELQLLLKLSHVTESFLNNSYQQTKDNTLREKYLILLKLNGYASPNGFVKRERLYKDFSSKFSEQLLGFLQSPILFKESDWLTMIFQKNRKSFHPVRHILIMFFLETDLNHLFNMDPYRPFGQGPWLCLNVVCPSYLKPNVTSLRITSCYDTGKPVGTFRCDCGFVFSRRGPDKNINDQYCIGTIKDYGKVWKYKLTEMVNGGKSLSDIAKVLRADRETVKKYAAELKLKVPWKLPRVKTTNTKEMLSGYETQLKERKSIWLELQNKYPEKTKTEIRKMAPDVYAFLYKNERDWLNNFSPVKKRIQTPYQRIDWEERDTEILAMVMEATSEWDTDFEKPTKITVASIGRKINKLSLLQKKADKLPKTMNYIYEIAESTVAFQKRRAELAINQLIGEGEPIIDWKIYKKAGLRPTVSNEVKRLITLRTTEYETVKR